MTDNENIQNRDKALIPVGTENAKNTAEDYLGNLSAQAEDYGQKLQDAAMKAKDYASERLAVASDKFKELQERDPQELLEDAKDYARKEPGKTILISAAIGLVVGAILRGRR